MNVGCYGSIFCNNEKSEACGGCKVFVACNEIAYKSLQQMRQKFDVEHLVRKYQQTRLKVGIEVADKPAQSRKRVPLTEYQQALIANDKFPVKARKMMKSLFHKGIDGGFIRTMIRGQSNPFQNGTPVIMEAGCRLLMMGELTMHNLKQELFAINQGDVCPKTVSSQASTVINTLMLMGVVVPKEGRYNLRSAQ